MQKLAQTFHSQITAQLLNKGATHVVILNTPDVTLTPQFQAVLQRVRLANGAGVADLLQAMIRNWTSAYNAQLKASVGDDARVAIVDFYADLADEVANPGSFGLTNATLPVCPSTGSGYDLSTCTSSSLEAVAGKTPGWWKRYAFSDDFHPTPYGHQLLAASVARALARAGWL